MLNRKKSVVRKYILYLVSLIIVISIPRLIYLVTQSSISQKPPKEYLDLFKENVGMDLTHSATFNTKNKNPIAVFEYKKYYLIFVYKIKLQAKISLLNSIKEIKGYESKKNKYLILNEHGLIREPNFSFYNCINQIGIDTNLYLTFDVDSIITGVKNDSMICYTMPINNFAMKYSKDGQIDIQIKNTNERGKTNFNILFIRKEGGIYFLAMSPIKNDNFSERDLLSNLINYN